MVLSVPGKGKYLLCLVLRELRRRVENDYRTVRIMYEIRRAFSEPDDDHVIVELSYATQRQLLAMNCAMSLIVPIVAAGAINRATMMSQLACSAGSDWRTNKASARHRLSKTPGI